MNNNKNRTKGYICPKCGSDKVLTERRPYGNSHCEECAYTNETKEFILEKENEDQNKLCK